jgi:uncharacterized protein YktA (UPF0223 family)
MEVRLCFVSHTNSHLALRFNNHHHQEWSGAATLSKSKTMSAKNAWGTTTGYADKLMEQGMEATRAQQLENWNNQQEVLNKKRQQKYMTEEFDKVSGEENWRSLSSFGVERNQVRTDHDEKVRGMARSGGWMS